MTSQPTTRDQLERALILLRRSVAFWRRGVLVFVVGMLFAVPFVFTRPRAYKSDTVILYQETIRSADITNGEGGGDNVRRVGARLREVLLSRASLEPIIVDMKLYTKPGETLGRGELIAAVEDMRKSITFRAREGDTFEISFVGATPEQAQEVTRRLADLIVQEAVTRRAEHAKTLKEFLDAESERNKTDLKSKESELAKFVALHPALAARLQGLPTSPSAGAAPSPPIAPPPSDPVLASLEARAARVDRQLRALAGAPLPPPKPAPTFQPPPESAELVAARKDLADKLSRYTDKHPDVIAARNRLKAAEAAQAEVNEAAAAAFAAQQAARARQEANEAPTSSATDETALRKELADLQAQIAARRASKNGAVASGAPSATDPDPGTSVVALEVEFRRLQREVAEGRDRQRQLDEKLFRASITASSVMNDRNIQVSILDPAYLPMTPVSKPRTLLLAALLVLCIVLAVATAVASASFDDRVYDRVDLERLAILPVLGVIPKPHSLPPKR